MGILKEKKVDEIEEKMDSILDVEKEKDGETLENKFPHLKEMYSEESLKVVGSIVKDIQTVILGGQITFDFTDEDTGVPGLNFSFKTLTTLEEKRVRSFSRQKGWDVDPSQISIDLITQEELALSLISYSSIDLEQTSISEKKEKIDGIPAFIINNYVMPRFFAFKEAFLILQEKEVFSFLLTKSSKRQN